jgi:hypothetical protein
VQCLAVVEPLADCEFAGQAVQMADPGLVYVLEPQIAQSPPFGPVNPSLQVQLVNAVEPRGDCELGGQVLHGEDPGTLLYVLAWQTEQKSGVSTCVSNQHPQAQHTCVASTPFTA